MAFATWNADLPVTSVDEEAGAFTVFVDDPMLILMGPGNLAASITLTIAMQPDNPVPVVVGSLIRLRCQATI